MPNVPFSLRISATLKSRLEDEARRTERSASYLANKAIESMLNAREQKRKAIEQALMEAEKGEFISQQAMHRWMDNWDSEIEGRLPDPDITPPTQ